MVVVEDGRHLGAGSPSPRVLVILYTSAAWSRGILRGFMSVAHELGWTLLHYHPNASMSWLAEQWSPAAALIGPELPAESLSAVAGAALVSVNVDRSDAGIASVCLDEEAIAATALDHLLGRGLRQLSTFRFDDSPFAIARERAFVTQARAAQLEVVPGWGSEASAGGREEDPTAILAWLRTLPRPCGVFTCTDSWGRVVARYARVAGLRVPEDLALLGVDNDVLECELISPPLSSVMIPWREVGQAAAQLLQQALSGKSIAGRRTVLSPLTVAARRSSDVLAVEDPLVARAVRWIRENAERRCTVGMVASAVGGGRQRLERRFRASLGRTIHHEIRRAHVDVAKTLLEQADDTLAQIAKRSGFTTAALLNEAFQRETGMSPGHYRRRIRTQLASGDE